MSIRITNNNTGRTIIVKNQNDMNHLDTSVTSLDTSKKGLKMFGNDSDKEGYQDSNDNGTNKLSSWFDLDSFDKDDDEHYRDVTAYPMSDEIKSWFDPTTVDTPNLKMTDTNIPDDQVDPALLDDDSIDTQSNDDPMAQNAPQDDSQNDPTSIDPNNPDASVDPEEAGDFQGQIRTVHGACLVYKRKDENGTYDELWIYNVGSDLKVETSIRKAILSGTDIDPNTQMSDDGEQKAKTYTIGNVQFLKILGMVQ